MTEIILVYVPAIFAIVLSLPYALAFFVGVARAICCKESANVR